MDLKDASHEQAVEAIRKAGNPVVFMVQSIINRPRVSKHRGQGRPIQTVFTLESSVSRAHVSLGPEILESLKISGDFLKVCFSFLFFFD